MSDFESPRHLADYIKFLDQNDDEYVCKKTDVWNFEIIITLQVPQVFRVEEVPPIKGLGTGLCRLRLLAGAQAVRHGADRAGGVEEALARPYSGA